MTLDQQSQPHRSPYLTVLPTAADRPKKAPRNLPPYLSLDAITRVFTDAEQASLQELERRWGSGMVGELERHPSNGVYVRTPLRHQRPVPNALLARHSPSHDHPGAVDPASFASLTRRRNYLAAKQNLQWHLWRERRRLLGDASAKPNEKLAALVNGDWCELSTLKLWHAVDEACSNKLVVVRGGKSSIPMSAKQVQRALTQRLIDEFLSGGGRVEVKAQGEATSILRGDWMRHWRFVARREPIAEDTSAEEKPSDRDEERTETEDARANAG